MKKTMLLVATTAMLVASGCATKRYGRVAPLTGAEMQAYSCREVALEIAKVQSFQTQITEGAEFNAASAFGILGDFGIGNSMERGAAEKSAAIRLQQLRDLQGQKNCAATTLGAADLQRVHNEVAAELAS